MASVIMASSLSSPIFKNKSSSISYSKLPNHVVVHGQHVIKSMRVEKSLEELYNVKVEHKVSQKRLTELGASRWSTWKSGKAYFPWTWQVDQLVYVEEGEVRVVPEGSEGYMSFVAGDLVRYPKWFEATLYFNAPYQERYSFRAYGDD